MQGYRFDPRTSPMAFVAYGGATDGTTDPQIIVPFTSGFVRPFHGGNANGLTVEPQTSRENGVPFLDAITRLMFWGERVAGTGTWLYDLEMRRGTGGANETRTIISGAELNSSQNFDPAIEPVVLDDAFPPDFMRQDAGSPGIGDVLNFQISVTPGQASIQQCWFHGIMMPSPKAAGGGVGRGHFQGSPPIRSYGV